MDFFSAQDHAHRSTGKLVMLFITAVIMLVMMTNVLVMVTMGVIESNHQNKLAGGGGRISADQLFGHFSWELFAIISAAVSSIVLLGTLYKMAQLSGGGRVVAEMLGGTLVADGGGDVKKQRLLNIVEEIAIASGTPVPPVYVLEEEMGINAFAAGYKSGDAVVAVTRGTLNKLNREELQGVIAHEFSHILNGDMRINLRLVGILHGILVIGLIGYHILRSSSRGRSSRNNGGGILVLALGLMAIGFAGSYIGGLIKAAVSRQREYLADASAVQFTRNPGGIAGALKRIGGADHGSLLDAPDASEFSHSYFSAGVSGFFANLSATHPPLEARIRAIEPNWDGEYIYPDHDSSASTEAEEAPAAAAERDPIKVLGAILAGSGAGGVIAAQTAGAVHLDYAQALIQSLPALVLDAAHEPHGARAIIYILLLDHKDQSIRDKQLEYLKGNADDGVYEEVVRIARNEITPAQRLPLVNIALASLHQLSEKQYKLFMKNLDAVIHVDSKMDLFEWAIQKIVHHALEAAFGMQHRIHGKTRKLSSKAGSCAIVFSMLAQVSRQRTASPEAAFSAACEAAGMPELSMLDKKELNYDKLNAALDDLNRLHVLIKPMFLKACIACIKADNTVTSIEAELFRALSEILDCPMPPLLATV